MINTIKGNVLEPVGDGLKIIPHVCNDMGRWGAGFVLALSAKWSEPEEDYRTLSPNQLKLGTVQFVRVEDDIIVANMIGQHDTRWYDGVPPIRYDAIRDALKTVNQFARNNNASIHCPKFVSDLAGGKWSEIEDIISETIDDDIEVTVYEYEDRSSPNFVPNGQ